MVKLSGSTGKNSICYSRGRPRFKKTPCYLMGVDCISVRNMEEGDKT